MSAQRRGNVSIDYIRLNAKELMLVNFGDGIAPSFLTLVDPNMIDGDPFQHASVNTQNFVSDDVPHGQNDCDNTFYEGNLLYTPREISISVPEGRSRYMRFFTFRDGRFGLAQARVQSGGSMTRFSWVRSVHLSELNPTQRSWFRRPDGLLTCREGTIVWGSFDRKRKQYTSLSVTYRSSDGVKDLTDPLTWISKETKHYTWHEDDGLWYQGDRRTGNYISDSMVPTLLADESVNYAIPDQDSLENMVRLVLPNMEKIVELSILGKQNDADLANLKYEAFVEAITSVQALSFNSIAFLKDLSGSKETLGQLSKLLAGKGPKGFANVYLFKKYVYDNTKRDFSEFIHAMETIVSTLSWLRQRSVHRTYHGSTSGTFTLVNDQSVKIKFNCSACITPAWPDTLGTLYAQSLVTDMYPSLENLWDLIPYSFVVDWFINVGDQLENILVQQLQSVFDLVYLAESMSLQSQHKISTARFDGSLTYSAYHRRISHNWPPMRTNWQWRLPASHWLDGLALLVQKL